MDGNGHRMARPHLAEETWTLGAPTPKLAPTLRFESQCRVGWWVGGRHSDRADRGHPAFPPGLSLLGSGRGQAWSKRNSLRRWGHH